MGNFKINLKYYGIFLITLIFYCLGIIVHFIAQHNGSHPQFDKEILEKASPEINVVNDAKITTNPNTNINNTISNSDPSTYASPDNLFYFIQISDIHMSDKYTSGAQGHLFYFFKKMIPIIDPNFLFITGDITDSYSKSLHMGTSENEWIMYRNILEHTGVDSKNNGTFIWDVRGNHDCFMTPEWNCQYNYFKTYAHTKTRGFSFHYDTSYGTYSFVGLEGCPIVSTANPFFGVVDEVTMNMYSEFMDKNKANPNNKHNFVFMHFPESSAKFGKSSSGKGWNDYTKDISVLFTGHYHNLGGKNAYVYHHDFLEMEVNDFKIHGIYRIVSVDHDMVSVTDYPLPFPQRPYNFHTNKLDDLINHPPDIFNQEIPPIVHITLPKNSKINLKRGEPLKESFASEYIRVLVFSHHPPQNLALSLYIDGQPQTSTEFQYVGNQKLSKRSSTIRVHTRDEQNQTTKNEQHTVEFNTPPLWIAKWDNSIYRDGNSHTLKVEARVINANNTNNNSSQIGENTISFRFDDKKDTVKIPLLGKILMKFVLPKSLPVAFGIIYLLYEAMILLSRWYAVRHIIPNHPDIPFFPNKYIGDMINPEIEKFKNGNYFQRHFIGSFIEAFSFDGIFYPLQILLICLLVLPAKIGILTRSSEHVSKIGGEFLYGSYNSGQWSNVADQYGLYIFHLILIPIVDTFIIVSLNHKKERNRIYVIILLILLFLFQFMLIILLSLMTGGILAIFIAPFPNWIGIYCWILIKKYQ